MGSFESGEKAAVREFGGSWGSYKSPIMSRLVERGWGALDFQPKAVSILRADLRRLTSTSPESEWRLPNAYLFAGPTGSGQEEAFALLAASVLCERANPKADPVSPCWECKTCKAVVAGTHPDVSIYEPEGNTYLVESIRDGVVSEAKYSGADGGHRFVMLREAERLAAAASNALLRTIEEPLGRVTFVLGVSPDADAILPTLRSRCREIPFLPVPPARLRQVFLDAGYPAEKVEVALKASDGTLDGVARAIDTRSFAEFADRAEQLIGSLLYDASANPYEVSGMLRESIESVVNEIKSALEAEIEEARRLDEELGLSPDSGRAHTLSASKHRRLRRAETALCNQVVTVCESLALTCGLIAAGLSSKAAIRHDRPDEESSDIVRLLAGSVVAGPDSSRYLSRIVALAREARSALVLNPRIDLWLDSLMSRLAEIVLPA